MGMLQPELVLPETSYPDSTPPPVVHLINMLKLQGPGGGRIKRTPPDPSFIACACVSFLHHPAAPGRVLGPKLCGTWQRT